jgi:hypothetical protein
MSVQEQKAYIANCIEHGERFITTFRTVEVDEQRLLEIGIDLAGGWGGECVSVEETLDFVDFESIFDYDEDLSKITQDELLKKIKRHAEEVKRIGKNND